jgi:hypothetical protein
MLCTRCMELHPECRYSYPNILRASPTVPFKKNQMTLFERLASSEVIRAKTLLQRTIQIALVVFTIRSLFIFHFVRSLRAPKIYIVTHYDTIYGVVVYQYVPYWTRRRK